MKNKKLFARLMCLSLSVALSITAIPIKGNNKDFISNTGHNNTAITAPNSIETGESTEFRGSNGETNKAEKKKAGDDKGQNLGTANTNKKNQKADIVNGKYTLDTTMWMKGAEPKQKSMSDVMFAQKVDVTVKDDEAELKFYIAYPVPNFPTLGKNGSVTNFYLVYNEKKYMAKSDITTKPLKEAKQDHEGFGLVKGKKIPMQILTLKLPKAAIEKDVKLLAGCFVNVFMNKDVELYVELNKLTLVEKEALTKPEKPNQEEKISKYVIENLAYSTNLSEDTSNPKGAIFSLSFDNKKYKLQEEDYKLLLEKGKIKVCGGKLWTLKDAGFQKTPSHYNQGFISSNLDFIKEFVNEDTLKITFIDQDGNVAKLDIQSNRLNEELRKAISGNTIPEKTEEEKKKAEEEEAKKKAKEEEEKKKAEEEEAKKKAEEEKNKQNLSEYKIVSSEYSSRLDMQSSKYGDFVKFQLAFETQTNSGAAFSDTDAKSLIENGKIQINDGKIWTFNEAKLKLSENTKTYFESDNKEFIKEFIDAKELKVKVIDAQGKVASETLKNRLDDEQIKAFKASPAAKPKEEDSKDEEGNAPKEGLLKIDKKDTAINKPASYLDPRFIICFQPKGGNGMQTKPVFPKSEEKDFAENTRIEINKIKFGTMAEAGFEALLTYEGSNAFRSEGKENLKKIASVLNDTGLNVKLINKEYGTIKFYIENKLPVEIIKEITGSDKMKEVSEYKENQGNPTKPTNVKDGVFKTLSVDLVKSQNHGSQSMAAPTMKTKAEIITTSDGKSKLILHFAPTIIYGIRAYATGLKLHTGKGALVKGQPGDIKTEFIMFDDRSAVCIVDLPKADEAIYEGYVESNVMGNPLALKLYDIKDSGSAKDALAKLVSETSSNLENKTYYEEGKNAVKQELDAAKNSKDYCKSYIDILKSLAKLNEKKNNPFANGDLFFVPVEATGTLASPATTDRSLQNWGRVTKEGAKYKLTVVYDSYVGWNGRIGFKNVKVLNDDGTEIPSEYKYDSKHFSGVLSFVMPSVPSSGIFKTQLTALDGKTEDSDLMMSYSGVCEGAQPELLAEAIGKYDSYKKDDYVSRGNISEDKENDFTASSWSNYIKALNKCKTDFKNSAGLNQKTIDDDVTALRDAKYSLTYKKMIGKGNTANLKTTGINNPNNFYDDGGAADATATDHPVYVGWAGSRVVFGGKTYKVLNDGLLYDKDARKEKETGKLLIMADDSIIQPWTKAASKGEIKWDKSNVRNYLNSEFYNKLNTVEKSLVVKTKLDTFDYVDESLSTQKSANKVSTEDNVFIADFDTMTSSDFGFASRDSRNTSLYYIMRNLVEDSFFGEFKILSVKPLGRLGGLGLNENFTEKVDAYPMMNLDKSKILMTIADNADISYLNKVSGTEHNVWKLLVKDSSITAPDSVAVNDRRVTVAGDNLYAAIIKGDINKGTVKYFGKVANSFDIPEFKKSEDKLYVFASKSGLNEIVVSEPTEVPVDKDLSYVAPKKPVKPIEDKKESIEEKGLVNGKYSLDATMWNKADPGQKSMSDKMFAQKVDVTVKGDEAELKLYIAYPVPNFAKLGKDGSVKNFYIEYKGQKYMAESDISTKPLRAAKITDEAFGLVKGKKIPMQILTVRLPKTAIEKDTRLVAGCYVNVVMNSNVKLDIEFKNLKLVEKANNSLGKDEKKPSNTVNKDTQASKDKKNNNSKNNYSPIIDPIPIISSSDNSDKKTSVVKADDKDNKKAVEKDSDIASEELILKSGKSEIKAKVKADKNGLAQIGSELLKKTVKASDNYKVVFNVSGTKKDEIDIYIPQNILKELSKNGCKNINLKSKVGDISINKAAIKALAKKSKGIDLVLSKKNGNYSFKVVDSRNKSMNTNKLKIKVSFK